jgi:hypothetical protein
MKVRVFVLIALGWAALVAGAQEKSSGAETKEKAAAREKKEAPAPKRVTGPDGKTYSVRQTPFGPVKVEEKPEDPKTDEPPANMRAFEDGDNIRFERPTPFGVARWVRKKNELNDTERAVWEREQRKRAQAETTRKKEGE